jgi:hypothetical protein
MQLVSFTANSICGDVPVSKQTSLVANRRIADAIADRRPGRRDCHSFLGAYSAICQVSPLFFCRCFGNSLSQLLGCLSYGQFPSLKTG